MITSVDASAVVDLFVRSDVDERVRRWLSDNDVVLVTVAHLDAEMFAALISALATSPRKRA